MRHHPPPPALGLHKDTPGPHPRHPPFTRPLLALVLTLAAVTSRVEAAVVDPGLLSLDFYSRACPGVQDIVRTQVALELLGEPAAGPRAAKGLLP